MSSVESLGFNPSVWLSSLFKRLIECSAGRGGVEAIRRYMDNIPFVPELAPLRQDIKMNAIFFETAMSKCDRKLLQRPLQIRQDEIFETLGCKCDRCGNLGDIRSRIKSGGVCRCGGTMRIVFADALRELIARGILPQKPEIILMHVAYDRLASAFSSAYQALSLVMLKTSELFGWEKFHIDQPQLRNYLDQFFFHKLAGEQKIPAEEKQILQFLVRGTLTRVPVDKAVKLIHLGMEVIKYGYIYQFLHATGAYAYYDLTLREYNGLYDELNESIMKSLAETYAKGEEKSIVRVSKTLGGYYAPCLIMPRHCWEPGQIAKEITLEPVYRMPIFPKAEYGPLEVVYGPRGSGKTFLLSAIVCYVILSKHELVFSPLNDKSNSYSIMGLPLFPYNKRTETLGDDLRENLGVEPQGIPTLTLTVVRKGEGIIDTEKFPPTIYDRLIEVENPKSFTVDFNIVIDELKAVSEQFGFSKPVGMLNVRNMDRYIASNDTNIDVEVASNLLIQFDQWRKSHLSQPARVVLDEVSYLASSRSILYAGDALRGGETLSDFIKESRRSRLSIECSTQRPLEIISEIRDAATNVFFRDLPSSKDKARSQIDFLLEGLQLEDPSIKGIVRDINNRGLLGKNFWFWYNHETRGIEVIKPCPPVCCLQDIALTPQKILHLYEKKSGEKILLNSWDQVKTISAESKIQKIESSRIR